ncbi:ABC transporter ATP-binding protein [Burkholderia pseudomultivorans]|uniref:ABC transporter ATP-binding protein n=1 Tax=Burkholderia multivorans TaxID=87883 RepID=A0AB37B189_9BURK|nr:MULTISPECIES: ABC transporter ATP-binding protein [Burkholderia cepacia complex]MDS0792719.1 ABC transporter ATP-binding protein [Burkholderia pseudomultivorans]PRE53540.1 ABC transporter ATP-binding protein [Burkholderia multivorans]PRE53797.1 ABC transporter ATP-binding protein [Burkholderia multivorans]
MIELQNLTKSYVTTRGRKYIFRELSFSVPPDKNIALIGRNGAGKSTLMRLLCGTDIPDSGKIVTDKRISWPVGLGGGYQGSLTGRQNAKFVCRTLGAEGDALNSVLKYVEDFAELGEYFDQPVNTYSSGMRARLAFGMSLAFDFDYYMVDEAMSVGDAHFREKAEAEFKRRVGKANLILVTHGMAQVRKMCDIVLLLNNGEVKVFDDVEEGIAVYLKL